MFFYGFRLSIVILMFKSNFLRVDFEKVLRNRLSKTEYLIHLAKKVIFIVFE